MCMVYWATDYGRPRFERFFGHAYVRGRKAPSTPGDKPLFPLFVFRVTWGATPTNWDAQRVPSFPVYHARELPKIRESRRC
jgi:hypothetical protein